MTILMNDYGIENQRASLPVEPFSLANFTSKARDNMYIVDTWNR